MSKYIRENSHLLNKIRDSIFKGLSFIEKSQLPSGEFPTYVSANANMKSCHYIKTIAMTVLVADCLKHVRDYSQAKQMIEKSIQFLLNQKENEMVWRFFGKNSNIIPDLDDICYTLAFLKENKVDLDYGKFGNELLRYRNAEGLFYTWFPKKGKNNNVDWVTNTNILYFFYCIDKRITEVENYLKQIITEGKFAKGSLYYHSPYSFIYFFTRLYSDKNAETFSSVIPVLIDFLLMNERENIVKNEIEDILAEIGLINSGFEGLLLDKAIEKILDFQNKDGGWAMGSIFRHRTVNRYYGSRELSTAFAIKCLAKYQRRYSSV
ncbi:MAG: hypothetical protein KAX39_00950 [candidate division Zixibacteria bacterium]|nr:hypothetical protein [candidate division Zixibacteria bacterium]